MYMENNPQYIEDLLFGYFTQELTPEQEKELLEWLREDPAHKEKLSRMADEWATAHVPLFMSTMQSDLDCFFEQSNPNNYPGRKSRIGNWMFIRNIAAAILALVTVGYFSYSFGQQETQDEMSRLLETQQISSEIITPMGSTSKVLLPDGSLAMVNAGTRLIYNYNYAEGIREICLEGEAYFDVVPDKNRPFIVKSNGLHIKVLGTCFNVKSYPEDAEVKVALVSGSVNVKVNQAEQEAMDFTLSPERMLTFDKESQNVGISSFRGKDIIAWTTGTIKFENLPFASIAKELERKFDIQIRIESERLRKEVFSGSFSSGYSLEQILREVDIEKKYKWTFHKDEMVIRDKTK